MRVAVLGAGVTGITTAYYLDQQGFDVTVIDRQPLAAEETSFANGGQLSYSQPFPWSNPELPLNLLRWIGRSDAPLVFKLKADPELWSWGLRYLLNSQSRRFHRHAEKILELAKESRQSLLTLVQEENIAFEHEQRGILKLFTGAKEEEDARARQKWLEEKGLEQKLLSRSECMEFEPALKGTNSLFTGGTWSPGDGSGNAREFTRSLVAKLKKKGVEFLFDTTIDGFEFDSRNVTSVLLNGKSRQFDTFVLCAGAFSKPIAAMAGIHLPLYPVKGYSVTIPVNGSNTAPLTSITDESRHIVISRLGDQLRAAGTAEINGYQTQENKIREDMVLDAVMELFPDCGDAKKAVRWSGLRPMTTDSVPLIGKARFDNFYTNTGHGPLGWTLACGSAEILANNMAGKVTKLDIADYSVDRFI